MDSDISAALRPTRMVDSDHPDVVAFAHRAIGEATDARQRAVLLYYAVRDGFRYDPYRIDLYPDGLSASSVLRKGYGWCVSKSALLAAACRVVGIPARPGYADVRNHLSTERLRKVIGTDIYYWHGYTSIHLDGRWLKATAAFNVELCEKLGLRPLEFDGSDDSIYHPFDVAGNRHMEYLQFRGEFAEVPLQAIRETFDQRYPGLARLEQADFDRDVAAESGAQGAGPQETK